MFNIRHARYFIAAARSGQVSRAAVELNVSQSAVTAAIHQLEAQLGAKLFERRAQGVFLTEAGARFLAHAEAIVVAVDAAVRAVAEAPATCQARVRVGVTYTVAGYFIGPLLSRLRNALPHVEVALHEAERSQVEAALVAGDLDLAVILISNLSDGERIGFEPLVRSTRRLWCAAHHPLTRHRTVTLADVAAHPYVALTVDEALATQRRYWEREGVAPEIAFATTSVEAVRTFVAAGLGVTVLSDMVYRPWSLDGARIDTRNLETPVPTMDVGVAWSVGREPAGAAREVVDFLARAVAADRGPASATGGRTGRRMRA